MKDSVAELEDNIDIDICVKSGHLFASLAIANCSAALMEKMQGDSD